VNKVIDVNQSQKVDRLVGAAARLGIIVFLSGLALFAYAGTYSRFWADDYCYSATIKQLGLINGLVDWYHASGNRLSTLAVVAFTDLFGWRSIQFTSLGVLALWVAAWMFFLFQLRRLFHWTIAGYSLIILSLVEVYFAALLAPDRLQTIYWRMGTFHYTLPAALLLANLGLLASGYCMLASQRQKVWLWISPLSAFLGLFAAGLSETFAAMQAGGLALMILAAWIILRGAQRLRSIGLLAAPFLGTLIMMTIMAMAPANAWRQAVMPPPANLLLIVPFSLRFAGDYILYSLRGQIVPFLIYGGAVGLVAFLAFPTSASRLNLRVGLLGVLISLLGMYALIVCSFAPSAYAGLSYPAGRALMPACFALLAGLGATAVFIGVSARQAVASSTHHAWLEVAALVLFVLVCLYPFRAAAVVQKDIARLSITSARWDARDVQIRQSIVNGNLDVQVKQVDVVESLEDMGPNPTQWVNACVSVFYGARSVTAKP
jgi:hypothetical protein